VLVRRFCQVDVFADVAYLGNPVAVVLDGEGLSTEQMQRFAAWTNLSETTFVTPPTVAAADYALRIFTPSTELPFAGHPTLGTCHAWLSATGTDKDRVIQECKAGTIPVRRSGDVLSFAAPPLVRSGSVDEPLLAELAAILHIARSEIVDAQWVDNGPGWVAVLLDDADAVLALRPGNVGSLYIGAVGPYPPGSPTAFEVRAFFPKGDDTAEDPVTGSLNASVGEWLLRSGRALAPYVASQGTGLGRQGRVHLSTDDDGTIWVGGRTITCVSGTVSL
jgi:PhzF family phenazine biosynthesis protein